MLCSFIRSFLFNVSFRNVIDDEEEDYAVVSNFDRFSCDCCCCCCCNTSRSFCSVSFFTFFLVLFRVIVIAIVLKWKFYCWVFLDQWKLWLQLQMKSKRGQKSDGLLSPLLSKSKYFVIFRILKENFTTNHYQSLLYKEGKMKNMNEW